MYGRQPPSRMPRFGGPGAGLPVPKDLIALLVTVFVTYSLWFFDSAAAIPRFLVLTPEVWTSFHLWRLVTYPLVGTPGSGLWFLLELLILFWFGRDVYYRLGRRRFRFTLLTGALAASVVAVLVNVVGALAAGGITGAPFTIMQGQHMLLVMLIAAFATVQGDATIYLFFVLPVQAKWFLPLEILFAFMAFLPTGDLAGFLGICTAVGTVWLLLQRRGPQRTLRDLWLRAQRWWIEQKLRRMRKSRGFTVIPGDKGKGDDDPEGGGGGPFVH